MEARLPLAHTLFGAFLLLECSSTGLLCTAQNLAASQASSPASPAQCLPGKTQVFHIELNAQGTCVYGIPPKRLTDRNFVVSLNGKKFPVRVLQAFKTKSAPVSRFPTHLLLVIPANAPRPNDADLAKSLNRAFAEGWLVSVARRDGSFSPYLTNGAMLAAAMAETSSTPVSAEQANLSVQATTESLEKFPGRRLLLLDYAGAHDQPSPQWVSLEAKALARVYLVDGGEVRLVPADPGFQPRGRRNVYWKERVYRSGVFHEVKLDNAVKDAIADARSDYDLRFEIPSSACDLPGPFVLDMRNLKGIGPSQLEIELYTVRKQNVDGNFIPTRTTPPQKVVVQ
jgi:hypothetical protein